MVINNLKFYIPVLLLSVLFIAGCIDANVNYNNNYPNFTIEPMRKYTDTYMANMTGPGNFVSVQNVTVNVTVTSVEPEKITKYSSGTITYSGGARTLPVMASIEGVVTKTENVTLAYNETKTIYFDLGKIKYGEYTINVTTPTSKAFKSIQVKPYI